MPNTQPQHVVRQLFFRLRGKRWGDTTVLVWHDKILFWRNELEQRDVSKQPLTTNITGGMNLMVANNASSDMGRTTADDLALYINTRGQAKGSVDDFLNMPTTNVNEGDIWRLTKYRATSPTRRSGTYRYDTSARGNWKRLGGLEDFALKNTVDAEFAKRPITYTADFAPAIDRLANGDKVQYIGWVDGDNKWHISKEIESSDGSYTKTEANETNNPSISNYLTAKQQYKGLTYD